MQFLGPREQQVLSLRFGLAGQERLSLTQVGKILAVSKERVRQIEERALKKLARLGREQRGCQRALIASLQIHRRTATTAQVSQSRRQRGTNTPAGIKPDGSPGRCSPVVVSPETAVIPMPETSTRSGPERIPVGPFLHYLMAECGVSPHTLAAYRSDLMRFVRWQKSEAPGPLASLECV